MGILSQTVRRLRVALNIRTSEPQVATLSRGFVTPDNGDSLRVLRNGLFATPTERPLIKFYNVTGAGLIGEAQVNVTGIKKGDHVLCLLQQGATADGVIAASKFVSPIENDNELVQSDATDLSSYNYILIVQSVL